jgi:hypothetical protein
VSRLRRAVLLPLALLCVFTIGGAVARLPPPWSSSPGVATGALARTGDQDCQREQLRGSTSRAPGSGPATAGNVGVDSSPTVRADPDDVGRSGGPALDKVSGCSI